MKMLTDYDDVADGFRREACYNLDYSRDRILHCVAQLSDEDLWWRPRPEMNAIGNLLLHVCGNMRQWMVCPLTGQPDDRDRPAEFAERGPIPAAELIERLNRTVEDAKRAIRDADDDELLRVRFVQIADCTGIGAIWHSVAHLEGHAQEIIYATRLRLGERYRFKGHY